jgi:hypothetical protein
MLMLIPAGLAATVTRTLSTNSVTYSLSGVAGSYGVLIVDTLSGGCTLSDGTMKYVTLMTNPETTKTVPFTQGSGSCTFKGDWDYAAQGATAAEHGAFVDATTGAGACVPATVVCGACNSANKKVCTDGCAQTMQDCAGTTTTGTTTGTTTTGTTTTTTPQTSCEATNSCGYCGIMSFAKGIDSVNYCIIGTVLIIAIIGGIVFLARRY